MQAILGLVIERNVSKMKKEHETIDREAETGNDWNGDKKAEIETEIETKRRLKDQETKGENKDPVGGGALEVPGLQPESVTTEAVGVTDRGWDDVTEWSPSTVATPSKFSLSHAPGEASIPLRDPNLPIILQLALGQEDFRGIKKNLSSFLFIVFFLSGLALDKSSKRNEILRPSIQNVPQWRL